MALSRVHTWVAGEVLLAADQNAEFNNILANAADLVSPFTKAISMGGFSLNFDAANSMSLTSSTKGLNLSSTTAINDVFSTVASATTPDIWTAVGGVVNYTGAVTATGFVAAPQAGARRTLVCAGAAPFTAGANVLIDGYASGATYTAAAGDKVHIIAVTTTQFRLTPALVNATQALVDGASISWDASLGAVATVTIAANRTMAAPSNLRAGGRYVLIVTQDATGSRTLTWNAIFKGLGGTAMPQPIPTLSTFTVFSFTSPDGTALDLEAMNGTLTNPGNTTQALSDGATVNWDANLGAWATWTIGGNRTVAAPTNLKVGGRYTLLLTQDGTGGRTITWNAVFKGLYGASMPQPNSALSTVTIFGFESDGTNLYLTNLSKQPTLQSFTSGSGTYTTPAGATRIEVEIVGGGSGGAGSGSAPGAATAGGNSTFSTVTANGGAIPSAATGGTGGTASGGDINLSGQNGFTAATGNTNQHGGPGGATKLGGGGSGGNFTSGTGGGTPAANNGAGGGGAGNSTVASPGGGGGAGAWSFKVITSPAATYSYAVGAAGAAGTAGGSGDVGGAGSAGLIIVREFYN